MQIENTSDSGEHTAIQKNSKNKTEYSILGRELGKKFFLNLKKVITKVPLKFVLSQRRAKKLNLGYDKVDVEHLRDIRKALLIQGVHNLSTKEFYSRFKSVIEQAAFKTTRFWLEKKIKIFSNKFQNIATILLKFFGLIFFSQIGPAPKPETSSNN